MALNLTSDEFSAIRDQFLLIDEDGDCKLSREEMLKHVQEGKEDALDFMMKLLDADQNGTVEFHEYLEIMAFLNFNKGLRQIFSNHIILNRWLNTRTAGQFFRALDKDGDGYLTADELLEFYKMVGEANEGGPSKEEIEQLIQTLDKDGDGKVDLQEFMDGIDKF